MRRAIESHVAIAGISFRVEEDVATIHRLASTVAGLLAFPITTAAADDAGEIIRLEQVWTAAA